VSAEDAVLPSDWKHPHPFHRGSGEGEEVDEKSDRREFGIGRVRRRVPEMERGSDVSRQFSILSKDTNANPECMSFTGLKLKTDN
jgi:hypothetical protein